MIFWNLEKGMISVKQEIFVKSAHFISYLFIAYEQRVLIRKKELITSVG